jgi:hypothetical protein
MFSGCTAVAIRRVGEGAADGSVDQSDRCSQPLAVRRQPSAKVSESAPRDEPLGADADERVSSNEQTAQKSATRMQRCAKTVFNGDPRQTTEAIARSLGQNAIAAPKRNQERNSRNLAQFAQPVRPPMRWQINLKARNVAKRPHSMAHARHSALRKRLSTGGHSHPRRAMGPSPGTAHRAKCREEPATPRPTARWHLSERVAENLGAVVNV